MLIINDLINIRDFLAKNEVIIKIDFNRFIANMIRIKEELNPEIENYLKDAGYLMPDEEIVQYQKAGEGNMNMVVRIITDVGKLILKQSRPYVNKYPQIEAPLDRIKVERSYYTIINENRLLKSYSPEIFDFDDEHYTLLMEDLGEGTDYLGIYSGGLIISDEVLFQLIDYLLTLHTFQKINFPDNNEMKVLNHQHIFNYPYLENNGFDLDTIQPGLQKMALEYKTNEKLKAEVSQIGARYLEKGNVLLHGDFYPGSWLLTNNKIKVIDPEFAFMGDPEFDLGVMIASLYMADRDNQIIENCIASYTSKAELDRSLLYKYIGTEILRRVIGLAQLPLKKDLEFKSSLCKIASRFILS
jgi:5-methylthioribose kinase